jgi:hypothetical protein
MFNPAILWKDLRKLLLPDPDHLPVVIEHNRPARRRALIDRQNEFGHETLLRNSVVPRYFHSVVIAGLVPAIHLASAWTTGTGPVVTTAKNSVADGKLLTCD